MIEPVTQTDIQANFFENRLIKRYKHLRKWAARSGITCYRIYDRDIPEIPLSVDLYTQKSDNSKYLIISLFERPYEKSEEEEIMWLNIMVDTASSVLSIPKENIFSRVRRKQKGVSQYSKNNDNNHFIIVEEGNLLFTINLSDYLDTGLFLDHRNTRNIIRTEACNKKVLNLFCYTGSFSVYAASGKALSVDSVDLSNNYLSWAKNNFKLNGFNPEKNNHWQFICEDVLSFLKKSVKLGKKWDIIVLDPPTFSNSHKTPNVLNINQDWPELVNLCLSLLPPQGCLYFSSNSHKLKFEQSLLLPDFHAKDITSQTIPEDFKKHTIHRCFHIFSKKNLTADIQQTRI